MSIKLDKQLAERSPMSIEAKEVLIDCLTTIVNGKQPFNREDRDTGMCWLMRKAISKCGNDGTYVNDRLIMGLVQRDVCEQWDYYSGNDMYPVPANRGQVGHPADAYDGCIDKYDRTTEYGQLRLELAALLLIAFTDLEI